MSQFLDANAEDPVGIVSGSDRFDEVDDVDQIVMNLASEKIKDAVEQQP
jgi:hypothetical protein